MTIHEKLKHEKRNIEWSQLSWNWMSGCDGPKGDGVHCKGCYAKRIATMRLRGRYGYPRNDPFQVVLHPDKLWGHQPTHLPAWTRILRPAQGWETWISSPFKRWVKHPLVRKTPTAYFNVSMGDWMYAESNWRREALEIMKTCPHHIFVTLTKIYDKLWTIAADSPENDGRWKLWTVAPKNGMMIVQIPKNVIVGISVTNRQQVRGIEKLKKVPAMIRMICFEPLLEDVSEDVDFEGIGWVIIGKRTRQGKTPEFMPEKIWVDRLIAKADERGIPVFLKPSMTVGSNIPERMETPYERIKKAFQKEREALQTQTQFRAPPPPGRMCGSDGIY